MKQVFRERQKFGRFYYRFPNGEAGTDVFDRMASFLTFLFRTMGEKGYFETSSDKVRALAAARAQTLRGAPRAQTLAVSPSFARRF